MVRRARTRRRARLLGAPQKTGPHRRTLSGRRRADYPRRPHRSLEQEKWQSQEFQDQRSALRAVWMFIEFIPQVVVHQTSRNCCAVVRLASTCLLINTQMSEIALRHRSTTRWDMCKISVPSNTALALWARSNHQRLFLRSRHWAGSLRRHRFETILINEPLCDGWLHKTQIQFRAVLVTECLERSVGHRGIHYLELPIGDPFPHFDR